MLCVDRANNFHDAARPQNRTYRATKAPFASDRSKLSAA